MMRKMLLLAGAALMMATAAQAGSPSELSCVAKGYTAEQRTGLDALLPKVDFLGGSGLRELPVPRPRQRHHEDLRGKILVDQCRARTGHA